MTKKSNKVKSISKSVSTDNQLLTNNIHNNDISTSINININNFTQKSINSTNYSFKGDINLEGPEEQHYFYVNLSQNNKNLAYKFEQVHRSNELDDIHFEF